MSVDPKRGKMPMRMQMVVVEVGRKTNSQGRAVIGWRLIVGECEGQTEEQIRAQQRRVEETSRGLWGQGR